MDAKCPKCFGKDPECPSCKGSGFVAVTFAEGVWYTRDCLDCKLNIGTAIVGENGANLEELNEHPENMICPFCDGQAFYSTAEEPDDPMMYRLPLEHEEPDGKKRVRPILSQRLHRPRRCLSHRLRTNARKMRRIFRILNG